MYSMSEFGMPPISRSPLLYFLNQKKIDTIGRKEKWKWTTASDVGKRDGNIIPRE